MNTPIKRTLRGPMAWMPSLAPALIPAVLIILAFPLASAAADPAADLASRLNEVQKGASFVRLRLKVEDPAAKKKTSLQIQIKERRTATSTDVLYQILFPRERKGESVLLTKSAAASPSGYRFVLPDKLSRLRSADLNEPLFGSDLACHDIIENFFSWENHTIVGTEKIRGKDCSILESKPGRDEWSAYASVRSWIDPKRLIPLRVEKYNAAGKLVRRIDTTRVYKNDNGHYIPATMEVRREGGTSVTELEGSSNKVNVAYTDADFTVEKMTDLSAPRS